MPQQISTEARRLYVDCTIGVDKSKLVCLNFWAPKINIVRDSRWGRGQEVPGEKPYLSGRYSSHCIRELIKILEVSEDSSVSAQFDSLGIFKMKEEEIHFWTELWRIVDIRFCLVIGFTKLSYWCEIVRLFFSKKHKSSLPAQMTSGGRKPSNTNRSKYNEKNREIA